MTRSRGLRIRRRGFEKPVQNARLLFGRSDRRRFHRRGRDLRKNLCRRRAGARAFRVRKVGGTVRPPTFSALVYGPVLRSRRRPSDVGVSGDRRSAGSAGLGPDCGRRRARGTGASASAAVVESSDSSCGKGSYATVGSLAVVISSAGSSHSAVRAGSTSAASPAQVGA